MQAILPFLLALARSNGIAFLAALGVFVLFIAPLILLARRAERRYLSQSSTEIPESGESSASGRVENTDSQAGSLATYTPQEGGQKDGSTHGLSTRQPTQ